MRLIGFASVSTHIGETMSLPCDCKDIYKFSICGEKLLDGEKWRKDNMIFALKFVGDTIISGFLRKFKLEVQLNDY